MKLSALRRAMLRASASLTALATSAAGVAVLAAPAEAANKVTPGNFTGYGFDQCVTQSQEVMDAWLTSSPYWAVGIYIAGDSRYCGDAKQTNLTAEWVSTQLRNGWKLIPITVGPQASCAVRYKDKVRINPNPENGFAAAREQGRLEAEDTVARAQALGITRGSTLWYDLEHVRSTDITARCRNSALTFTSEWTDTLHELGYVSGFYSSASSWIAALDEARMYTPQYTMPDRLWIAEWVKEDQYRKPPTMTPPSLYSSYLTDDGWMPGGRMRQYRGGHDETYGGYTINIDTNYLDLGRGTLPGRTPTFCGGTQVDFGRYVRLAPGAKGAQVTGLQCLLRRKRMYDGPLTGVYDMATQEGVRRFQEARGLRVTGRLLRSTWTIMLSEGRTPILKVGSGGAKVRSVQRALNAAVHAELAVDGIFGAATTQAVRAYQGEIGLRRTGVVASDTWAALQAGSL